jgi:hypothetical protein
LKFDIQTYIIHLATEKRLCQLGLHVKGCETLKTPSTRQLELRSEAGESLGLPPAIQQADEKLMRRLDKIIDDTIGNIRPHLNRMVRDVERMLEGGFIRTPSSNVLDDMIEGLEKDIRKFVDEVRALKRWSQPHPPDSSSNNLR